MKTAKVKNSTSSSNSSKPFFNKGGEGTFFAQKKEADAPFFQPMLIQPALAVGAPNDPFEQEADKVGRQVMDNFGQASTIQTKLSSLGVQTSLIQPMPIGTRISRMVQHRQNIAQAKCDNCEEEMMAQPKSMGIQFAGEGGTVSSNIEQRINSQRGSGSSMDAQTKGAMESSFGADFSGVKIHTGTPAVQMSNELNAHAFTVGSDIFFNKGRYQPQTKQGAGLLAHELTHTVQQGAAVQNKRINRRPLSKMLAKHEIAHLSSMDSNTLSRKEMAQLEKMPEEELMQQKEMFESNEEVDKVQKKDSGLNLRRCSGDNNATTSPTTAPAPTPTLKRTVTIQPTSTGCGGMDMGAIFSLDNATSSTNGYIVQKLTFNLNREDCSGTQGSFQKTYWEAWEVRGGIAYIGRSTQRHDSDNIGDRFRVPSAPGHKGINFEEGRAKYIDGYTAPNNWGNIREAGSLPATLTEPTGWTDTGTIHRWIRSEFDCCSDPNTENFTHQK